MRINKKSVQSAALVAIMAVSPICISAEEMPAGATLTDAAPTNVTPADAMPPAGMPAGGPVPFFVFDKDDNGSISEDEFKSVREEHRAKMAERGRPVPDAKDMPAFSSFDTDADGKLSRDELMAGQREQMKKMREMRMSQFREMSRQMDSESEKKSDDESLSQDRIMGRGMRMGRDMPAFEDFDQDKDGKIVQEEFDDFRAKRMAEKAKQGFPMRNAGKYTFADVDANSDGAISKDELADHQSQCNKMMHKRGMKCGMGRMNDRGMNQDKGAKCGMERNKGTRPVMNQRRPGMARDMERGMGPNANSAANQAAMQERRMNRMMASFSQFDLNRDGKVDEKEFNEAKSNRMAKMAERGYAMKNAGNAPVFSDFDANADGVVTAREFMDHKFKRYQQKMQQQRQQWQQQMEQQRSQRQEQMPR